MMEEINKDWNNITRIPVLRYANFPLISYNHLRMIIFGGSKDIVCEKYKIKPETYDAVFNAFLKESIAYFDYIPFKAAIQFYNELPAKFNLVNICEDIEINPQPHINKE